MQLVKKIDEGLVKGEMENMPLKNNPRGCKAEVEKIEKCSPGALHDLYRYAIQVHGHKANFEEITVTMNQKSVSYFQQNTHKRTEINLSPYQVYRWWKKNGRKDISPIEKPLDTPALRINSSCV